MLRAPKLLLVLAVAALLAGCTGQGAVTSASSREKAARADEMLANPPGSNVKPTGKIVEYDLYLYPMARHELYPGAAMPMWGFSAVADPSKATFPGPTLRVTEGDTLVVTLHVNLAGYNHTLHFHGQNVPWDQDGVPYMTQKVVEEGQAFEYRFVAKPAGTYWYHCHVDAQHHIDMGMYGALIVDPQDPADDPKSDGEFLMMLDDMDRYHNEGGSPPTSQDQVPQGGDFYSYQQWLLRQANDAATRNQAVGQATDGQNTSFRPIRAWYPVTYLPYTADYQTFLINGQAYPYTEALTVETDKVYRIRLVNAGNSIFAMHLHGHHVLVTHKDGVLLNSPYWADTVVLGPSERYDVYVRTDNPGVWDFHDHDGRHTQNDNIFPGGAMTMLCYAGFAGCSGGGGHNHGGTRSGDLVGWKPGFVP